MNSRVAITLKVPRAPTCESSRISRAISTVHPISSDRNTSASTPPTYSVTGNSPTRFFFLKTLKRPWSGDEMPYPKKRIHLPVIWSPEEVACLIDAAPIPFYRTILITLYGTGVRRAELADLKVTDVDAARMVLHVQNGKGGKDRDIVLSPHLLDELRAHYRRLARKPSVWLFPGGRW